MKKYIIIILALWMGTSSLQAESKKGRGVIIVPPQVFDQWIDFQKGVRDILQNPYSGLNVSLRGHLISKVSHERYLFSDGTGRIVVYIRDLTMPFSGVPYDKEIEIDAVVAVDARGTPELRVSNIETVGPFQTYRKGVMRYRVQHPHDKHQYRDYYYHYDRQYP